MITKTRYYDEFIRYYDLAKRQQAITNLGTGTYDGSIEDDLMCSVQLYDVVERKYAGFGQIMLDLWYGWNEDHPYWEKMRKGTASKERIFVAEKCNLLRERLDLEEWLYVWLVHRMTGSAINYAKIPSGYHNTVLPEFSSAETIEDMADVIREYDKPKFTSKGYQIAAFPKPIEPYVRGGDYYLCEYGPRLCRDFAAFLRIGGKKTFREMGSWALDWHTSNGLKRFKFQLAAWVADVGDYFPEFVELESEFYYGSNAIECLSYLAKPVGRMKKEAFLDELMDTIYKETGAYPYNSEDVACDFIRYLENYCDPSTHYGHLDLDAVWNSSSIDDHPKGRQRMMLELGLIDSFNKLNKHPSDDYVIKNAGLSIEEYQQRVDQSRGHTRSSNRKERETSGLVL